MILTSNMFAIISFILCIPICGIHYIRHINTTAHGFYSSNLGNFDGLHSDNIC